MLITLLIFFLILLVLVLSHEAGHFFSAKAFGIKVDEFGFGLPPRAWGIRRGGTLYSLNWLPFGGFVKILGEEDSESQDPQNFGSRRPLVRSTVLLAGIFANILLAFLVLTLASSIGIYKAVNDGEAHPNAEIAIIEIAPKSPAEAAGLEVGDRIENFKSVEEVQKNIKDSVGKELVLTIKRGGSILQKTLSPRLNPPAGEGPTGIALSLIELERSPWYKAPIDGAKLTFDISSATLVGFWELIKTLFINRQAAGIEVSGPVGIFNLTASVISLGFSAFLLFLAVLSINLAIINFLPFPGLDGGRFFFILIELIRGKKISSRTSSLVHGLGLALLILLMLVVTYHDIAKIF